MKSDQIIKRINDTSTGIKQAPEVPDSRPPREVETLAEHQAYQAKYHRPERQETKTIPPIDLEPLKNNATQMEYETYLADTISKFKHDPLGYIQFAFDWGYGELEGYEGPDTWQKDNCNIISERTPTGETIQIAVASGHGVGKGHGVGQDIDTPSGVKRWGDLKVGDELFSLDGNTKVRAIHPLGIQKLYKITFSDHSYTYCTEDHIWTVKGRQERRYNKDWINLTVKQILKKGVLRPNGKAKAKQWEIPQITPVEYPKQSLPLPPYFIGVWLGDGSGTGFHSEEPEIVAQIQKQGLDLFSSEARVGQYNIRGIRPQMRGLGLFGKLSNTKFIPEIYKHSPSSDRIELLRGLLDTDGECDKKNTVQYSSTSKQLTDDVIWLVRSLGGKASLQPTTKKGAYKDKQGNKIQCKDCYRITIQFPDGFQAFYVTRKQERIKPTEDRYLKRWIESIEYSHDEEAQCITVSHPKGLYLCNDFIPTHNSAQIAWLILWFMSTRPGCRIVVTANTGSQLESKTWAELRVWYSRAINKHWFDWNATKFVYKFSENPGFAVPIPWSKERPEAFAGTHSQYVMMIYDEASMIDDVIWEVTEGAMTQGNAIWIAFGNPTRNTGRFRECFSRFSHRWVTRQIDSRTAKMTDKKLLNSWVEDWGEDSDFVRVRVRGEFPRLASNQYISADLVHAAMNKVHDYSSYSFHPIIIGVDVARFGDDRSVIYIRQGLQSHGFKVFRGIGNMELANQVSLTAIEYRASHIFVDGGQGDGVIDRLRQLGYTNIFEVRSNTDASDKMLHPNKRCEMWANMKDWLISGGHLPQDDDLLRELTAIEYDFDKKGRVILEEKKAVKGRIQQSPDKADAVAQTFAFQLNTLTYSDEPYSSDYSNYNDYLDYKYNADEVTGY